MQRDVQAPKVQFRRPTPEDAEACGRIFHEAFSGINHQHGFPSEVPTLVSAIGILTILFSHPGFHCVAAELDGQIVGSVSGRALNHGWVWTTEYRTGRPGSRNWTHPCPIDD